MRKAIKKTTRKAVRKTAKKTGKDNNPLKGKSANVNAKHGFKERKAAQTKAYGTGGAKKKPVLKGDAARRAKIKAAQAKAYGNK